MVTITNNLIRNTKLANYMFEEQLCNLYCRKFIISHAARNELRVFDKTFSYSHDGVTFLSFRQVCHKVNAITGETSSWDWQGLQQTR